jgi:hypothetical protein
VSDSPEYETTTFAVKNESDQPLTVVLEPWGDEHMLVPKSSLRIYAVGPQPAHMDIVIREKYVSLWGWSGATLDTEAPPHSRPACP